MQSRFWGTLFTKSRRSWRRWLLGVSLIRWLSFWMVLSSTRIDVMYFLLTVWSVSRDFWLVWASMDLECSILLWLSSTWLYSWAKTLWWCWPSWAGTRYSVCDWSWTNWFTFLFPFLLDLLSRLLPLTSRGFAVNYLACALNLAGIIYDTACWDPANTL